MIPRWAIALLLAGSVSCGGSERPVHEGPVHEATPPPEPAPEPAPEPVEEAPPPEGSSGQCQGPAPGPGYECVRDCGQPVQRDTDPPPGWSWLSAEQAAKRKQFGCPICLPDDARIATPAGAVEISKLVPGAIVWGIDDAGRRAATRVLHVGSTPVPTGHRLSVLELADGRVLRASPGHPGPDGRAVGTLAPGETLDGSVIVRTRRVPYRGKTWDLVLAGGHARYLSDGVLLRSSLSPR